jgi:hypothetical protein
MVVGGLGVALAAHATSLGGRTFVPGVELGGAQLGMTKHEIVRTWGLKHGVCLSCRNTTWYFNDRPFQPQGTAVVFRRGRSVALFTVWKPARWASREGLSLGADGGKIGATYGELASRDCGRYTALLAPGRATSVFYVYRGDLWGFGLVRPRVNPCF